MFAKRRTEGNARRKNQAEGLDMADWRSIVARHSIMLALEPRFMFDGAGAEVADPAAEAADVFDSQAEDAGGDETVTVFNNGFGPQGLGDPDKAEKLALAVGSSATSGVTLDEDGSKLIGDIEITGGEDTHYVKIEIILENGGENKVDFDFNPNDFPGEGIWGEKHIDRTRQDEGIISVWGTREEINRLLDTLTFEGGENVYTKGGSKNEPDIMTVSLFSCDSEGKNAVDLNASVDTAITINEVNDIAVIAVPKVEGTSVGQVIGYEDVPLGINDYIKGLGSGGLELIDPDDLDDNFTIEFDLSRNWGKLSFGQDLDNDGALDGVWTSVGNGKYTFQGTRQQVQDLIDTLTYESPEEAYGNETLKMSVYDSRTATADRSAAVSIELNDHRLKPVGYSCD